MTDGLGATSYTWRFGDLLATEDGPWADDTLTYTYDATAPGLLTGLNLQQPAGSWDQTYVSDTSRRIASIASAAGQFDYTYHTDVGGFAAATRLPVQIALPGGGQVARSYDSSGRLLSTQMQDDAGGVLDASSYLYNAASQRTQLTRTDASTVAYTYDPAGQLLTAAGSGGLSSEALAYTYDASGSPTQRTEGGAPTTFTVNPLNELTGDGVNSYTYDANGNRTSKSWSGATPGSLTYTYDAENRLTSLATDTYYTPAYDRWKVEFQYDGWGRQRVRKDYYWDTYTGGWSLSSERRYVYDGRVLLQERIGPNTPRLSYTRGPDLSGGLGGAGGIGGLLAMSYGYSTSTGNWARHYHYHADANGNVTALIMPYNGSHYVVATYRYAPFGRLLGHTGTWLNPLRFSSKFIHEDSGLYDYGFRFYEPETQRWLTRDPLGEWGGLNLYGFVGNDPVNGVDPWGLDDEEDDLDRRLDMAAHGSGFFATYAYDEDTRADHDRIMCEGWNSLKEFGDGVVFIATTLSPIPGDEEAAAMLLGMKVGERLAEGARLAKIAKGLETRGIRPKPGTRVRPEGLPESWRIRNTYKPGGIEYYNPRNPNESIRVMQGNPNSPYPRSQGPYVRQRDASGTYLRQDGTPSPLPRGGWRDPDAHIPIDQFKFRP